MAIADDEPSNLVCVERLAMVGEGAGESVDPDPVVPTVGANLRGSTPAMPMLEGFRDMKSLRDPANSTVIRRHRETQVLPRFGPLVG
jgi:hypothetical protein